MHKLSTYALEQSDKLYVKSMLELAHRLYDTNWEYQEFQSNIVLVDIETQEGLHFWQESPKNTLLIAYAKTNSTQAEFFIQKPVRVQPFVDLLKQLSLHLQKTSQTVASSPAEVQQPSPLEQQPLPSPKSTIPSISLSAPTIYPSALDGGLEDPLFYPQKYLVGLLQQAQQQAGPTHFIIAGMEHLFFVPGKQICYCSFPQFTQINSSKKLLYCSPTKQVISQPASFEEISAIVKKQHFTSYPLISVLWFLALCASQGRMIQGYPRTAPMRLKQFPNFSLLPHEPIHIKLAAFMLKNTVSLKTVADQTHVPLARVTDFFNACALTNLVHSEAENTAEQMHKRVLHLDRQSLLKNILHRLIK